ncbi:3'-5' exonuclease [Ramlibacter sp. 2FC]|uniref:3'-5' exonuclease n=1 Tax=Ramlibacter sp. 2FC TaxID=2502188 RepID=UPI0010F9A338|nr:3'-5' exonuclease [Ramlibacter sp. 2FC]
MTQMALGFDAPAKDDTPAATLPTVPAPAADPLEAMAQALAQHPDYRVLRRLVPRADYGPAGPGERQRVLILDTETTGLEQRSDRIIELAMLAVDVELASGLPVGPVEVYEGFEDPGMPIPPKAREITGITDAMVQGHRLDEARIAEMAARADLVIAHNAGFDRPFVETRLPLFADKAWACSIQDMDWQAEGAGSAKLEFLAGERGWFYDAHRAQVDCHALLQVLAHPLKAGQTGLARLLQAASTPSFKLRATGSPFEAKDKLKARGYRWDGEAKVWWRAQPSPEELASELEWLRAQVYGTRQATVQVEATDSRVRYSARAGQLSERPL